MSRSSENARLTASFMRPLFEFAQPHRFALTVGIFFMVAETGVSLAVPWLGGRFVNEFLGGNRPSMAMIVTRSSACAVNNAAISVKIIAMLGRFPPRNSLTKRPPSQGTASDTPVSATMKKIPTVSARRCGRTNSNRGRMKLAVNRAFSLD